MKIYITIILFLLMQYQYNFADETAEIYFKDIPEADTVNFGMCLVNDSLVCKFVLHNVSRANVKIRESYPSFAVSQSPGHVQEFEEFNAPPEFGFPRTLFLHELVELPIIYIAKSNLSQFPTGTKEARLRIGLFDPDVISIPLDDNDLVTYRDFVIIARKTKYFIDGFDNNVNFDSVYINPTDSQRRRWRVQNSYKDTIKIDMERLVPVTANPEFMVLFHPDDLEFPTNKSKKDWMISYYPVNLGADTARFELEYHPLPKIYPDSIDVAKAIICGFGAEQKLEVSNIVGGDISNDTIFIGDVFVTDSKRVTVTLKNTGNMNFGALNEDIKNVSDDNPPEGFSLIKKLVSENENLFPMEYGSFIFDFIPTEMGNFIAKYVIESDIVKRKIYGFPEEVKKITFFIVGRGIEPKINAANNIINFGDVVIHQDCPSKRDTSIFISNNGNAELVISNIFLDPEPPSPFSIDNSELIIKPNTYDTIKLTFNSEGQPPDINFEWDLKFVSNCIHPLDTFSLKLMAKGIEPYQMRLSIPQIKSKPGNRVLIPILIEKDRISRAKTFDAIITYNKTLMKYYDFENIGTASSGAKITDINEDIQGGILNISLAMPSNIQFLEKDTLILLEFKTYLGNAITTPITFTNPVFGDGICKKALTPIITEGSFSIDSVCGLEYKINDYSEKGFRLGFSQPNPAIDNFEFDFEVPSDIYTKIELFNIYGYLVKTIFNQNAKKGINYLSVDCSELSPGSYYYKMQSGVFNDVKKVIIRK